MSFLSKFSKKDVDMTVGPMWDKILIFAIPVALSALMQQFFHSIDMAVVGKFVGQNELGAVGSNNSIINFLINFFMGLSAGSSVIIAQLLGANKLKTANKAVHTSLTIALLCGLTVMVIGIILSPKLLLLISTPPEILPLATLYLRLYFLGVPPLMLYNFSAAILRSRGNTTQPFIYLLIGGIINVILNLIFVLLFKWSVAGVAIATSISNLISCILILNFFFKDKGPLGISLKRLKIDRFILSKIVRIGLPMGIQACLFPISNMVVQSSINSLGTTVIAGNAAACSIEGYTYTFLSGFSQASLAFVSQNFGAKKIKRCRRAVGISIGYSFLVCNLFNFIFYLFMDSIIGLFTNDPQVALVANERISFIYLAFPTMIIMEMLTPALRGIGYPIFPTVISIVSIFGFRIIWLTTVFPVYKTFLSILLVYPISWLIVSIFIGICYLILMKRLEIINQKHIT